jgi:hypothetical protein
MNTPKITPAQRVILKELLERLNARRSSRNLQPVGLNALPPVPRDPMGYYLVDTYRVRRHWRRRPLRKL